MIIHGSRRVRNGIGVMRAQNRTNNNNNSDNAASARGLDRVDSVGVSFKNGFGWESDSPDVWAGANVYVFATGTNVNKG